MAATVTFNKPFALVAPSGWLIEDTMQYEFGGLLFGYKTPFRVIEVRGLLGGSSSGSGTPLSSGPGDTPGVILEDVKTIDIEMRVTCTRAEVEGYREQLENAFQPPPRWLNPYANDDVVRGLPLSQQAVLAFRRDGMEEPRIVFCRRRKLNINSNFDTTTGDMIVNIQLQADNPLKYSWVQHEVVLHLHSGDSTGEFEWTNEGNYNDGYPMYVKVRCPGPLGYKDLEFYRKYENFLGGYSYDRLTTDFAWNGNFDVDFKYRVTKPVGPLAHMAQIGWFRIMPGVQWIGVNRDPAYANGPLDVKFYIRHAWR